MSRSVFILGVGAQKSGTSFLYRVLSAHPEVRLSRPKEMHVLDAYFLPQTCGHFHRRRRDDVIERLNIESNNLGKAVRTEVERLLRELREESSTSAQAEAAKELWELSEKHNKTTRTVTAKLMRLMRKDAGKFPRGETANRLRHLRMSYDLSEYLDYFRELAEGRYLTGDITPSYQMMDAEHFRQIRDLLAPDFDIRVVFLMRDPIDRIFSAMRMDDRNGKRETNLAHERFARTFGDEKHRRRTDYQSTAKALDPVFPAGSVFYELYENLFRPETFERLGKFLGLSGLAPDFDTRVNASPTLGRLSPDAIAAARDFYAPTYDFCKKRFGEETVTRLWANA